MAVLGGVVQHGVVVQLVNLGQRADVAGAGAGHLHMALALLQVQVRHLERLAPVAHVELRARADGALVHAHEAELADVGVDADLEHLGQHVGIGIGLGVHKLCGVAFAPEEVGRVAFGRVGQQAGDDVQQFAPVGGHHVIADHGLFSSSCVCVGRVSSAGCSLMACHSQLAA